MWFCCLAFQGRVWCLNLVGCGFKGWITKNISHLDDSFFFNLQNFKESMQESREWNTSFLFSRQVSITKLRSPPCSGRWGSIWGQLPKMNELGMPQTGRPLVSGASSFLEVKGFLFILKWCLEGLFCLLVCSCQSVLLDLFIDWLIIQTMEEYWRVFDWK